MKSWIDDLDDPNDDASERALANAVNSATINTRTVIVAYFTKALGGTALDWAFKKSKSRSPELSRDWAQWDLPALKTLVDLTPPGHTVNCGDFIGLNRPGADLAWRAVLMARNKDAHKTTPFNGYRRFAIYTTANHLDHLKFSDKANEIRAEAEKVFGEPMASKTNTYGITHLAVTFFLGALIGALVLSVYHKDGGNSATTNPVLPHVPPVITTAPPRPSDSKPTPASPTRPDIPAGYLDSLDDKERTWTWSTKSLTDNGEMTLHSEDCEGVDKMSKTNRASLTGTLAQVRAKAAGLPIRYCPFCYEIDFRKRLKEDLNPELVAPAAAP